jgi:putative hydrolase of the HAD superfamily
MDDVRRVKPDPELFLSTLGCLNLAPHEAILFEDSLNGVIASREAGLFCVAIPNALMLDSRYDQANLVIQSMADLCLPDLIDTADAYWRDSLR